MAHGSVKLSTAKGLLALGPVMGSFFGHSVMGVVCHTIFTTLAIQLDTASSVPIGSTHAYYEGVHFLGKK